MEERFRLAVKSIECRDAELARKVIEGDMEIDHMEVDLEEECLKILALHQPVADHLRYIVAMLKMNNDLERIGDLAVNIAERGGTGCRRSRDASSLRLFHHVPEDWGDAEEEPGLAGEQGFALGLRGVR